MSEPVTSPAPESAPAAAPSQGSEAPAREPTQQGLLTDAPPPSSPEPTSWISRLPEELQTDPTLTRFKSEADLAKSYLEARSMIGNNNVAALPKEGDLNALRDLMGKLPGGVPEDARGYGLDEIEVPEGMTRDEGFQTKMAERMAQMGLPKNLGQQLMKAYVEVTEPQFREVQQRMEMANDEAAEAVRKAWGDPESASFRQRQDAARRAAIQKLGEDWKDVLSKPMADGTRLENFLPILNLLAEQGMAMHESDSGETERGLGGQMTLTPAQATAEIKRIQMDADQMSVFDNKQHPGYDALMNRWRKLHRIAAGEE